MFKYRYMLSGFSCFVLLAGVFFSHNRPALADQSDFSVTGPEAKSNTGRSFQPRLNMASSPVMYESLVNDPEFMALTDVAVYDVTDPKYGATPGTEDDRRNGDDDAEAINAALQDAVNDYNNAIGNGRASQRIIYLPPGLYYIEEPIKVPLISVKKSRWAKEHSHIWIMGAGRIDQFSPSSPYQTVITLRNTDEAAGYFTDADNPRGVIEFIDYGTGRTNDAFSNYVSGLEIGVRDQIKSRATDGAVGIVWAVNNVGGIRDVKLNAWGDGGHTGLALVHQLSGPGLVEGVRVDGFDTGIDIRGNPSQVTITDSVVRNQNAGGQGIRVQDKAAAIENLLSEQRHGAVAIRQLAQTTPGHVTLIDSTLTGSGADLPGYAIDNQAGHLYIRNVDKGRHDSLIRDHGVLRSMPGGQDQQYVSVHGQRQADLEPGDTANVVTMIGTDDELSPGFHHQSDASAPKFDDWNTFAGNYTIVDSSDLSNGTLPSSVLGDREWIVVDGSGSGNDSSLLQAALDSGKRYVVLVSGQSYNINQTLTIDADKVDFFYGGGGAELNPNGPSFFPLDPSDPNQTAGTETLVKVEGDSDSQVIIQGWEVGRFASTKNMGRALAIYNASAGDVVLKDVSAKGSKEVYRNQPAEPGFTPGTLYLENFEATSYGGTTQVIFDDQRVFARHFNVENNIITTRIPDRTANPHIITRGSGAQLWIFGQKVGETNGVYWLTTNGAKAEVLGAFINNAYIDITSPGRKPIGPDAANFVVDNSGEFTLVAVERLRGTTNSSAHPHPDQFGRVKLTDGTSLRMMMDDFQPRVLHAILPGAWDTEQAREQRVIGLLTIKSGPGSIE